MIFDSDARQQTWLVENGIAPFSVDVMPSMGSEFVASPTFEEPYWLFSADGPSPVPSSSTPADKYNGDYFSLCGSGPSSPDRDPETPGFFAPTSINPIDISSSAALHKSLPVQLGDNPYIRSNSYEMMDDDMVAPESAPVLPAADPTSRRKHKTRTNSASSESGSSRKSSTSTSKLRTASRKPKRSSKNNGVACNKPPVPDLVLQARASHNVVERQYRNRLNKQFEQLLAILPTSRVGEGDSDDLCSGDESRRFSKAEVLAQARRRIQVLEGENVLLVAERDRLKMSLGAYQRR